MNRIAVSAHVGQRVNDGRYHCPDFFAGFVSGFEHAKACIQGVRRYVYKP
ncbi:hypothetical protein ALO86_102318 [Pseudomonas syringae pv. berberidis]|nr:Unknown protein sequence [Pseudomonas syringae pv. maculicola]KPW49832.1 hypothetical protein ALO86_102318 [Pseudomonas syringae pv. berberidis]